MKKILITFLILLMTGCTVEYNIEFNNCEVNEEINIIEEKDNINLSAEKMFHEKIYSQFNLEGQILYKKNKLQSNNNNIYKLSQKYTFNKYKKARVLTECFDAVNLVKNEKGNYIFQTSKGFKCMLYNYYEIDSYIINITTDYEVINTNADSIKNNVYSWKIDNSNAENKMITFEFKNKNSKINIVDKKNDSKINIVIVLIVGLVLIIGIIVLIYALNLNKKRNKL